jgi:two-component system sensor histidine kinase KdpD
MRGHGERAHNSPMNADRSEVVRQAQADALLGELQRQGGGRLTIFLGAAPGVGKTYAMLSRGRELKKQGTDVVVGLVETHGRVETAGAAGRTRRAAAPARRASGPHAGGT